MSTGTTATPNSAMSDQEVDAKSPPSTNGTPADESGGGATGGIASRISARKRKSAGPTPPAAAANSPEQSRSKSNSPAKSAASSRKRSAPHSSRSNSGSAKRRRGCGTGKEVVINLDEVGMEEMMRDEAGGGSSEGDVFNFDSNKDSHPEPLKNISVERQQFGAVKFTRSPPTLKTSDHRYAGLERSMQNRSINLSQLSTTSAGGSQQPASLSSFQLNLSQSSSQVANSPGKTYQLDEGEDSEDEVDLKSKSSSSRARSGGAAGSRRRAAAGSSASRKSSTTPAAPRTPKSQRSSRQAALAAASSASASKTPTKLKLEEEVYKVPELSAEEQFAVDHPQEGGEPHAQSGAQPGARVMALFGRDYYPAIVCGRDGLGRYYIHYVEDEMNKELPPTGIVPLAALTEGTMVSYSSELGSNAIGRTAVILHAPGTDNAQSWREGIYKVQEEKESPNGSNSGSKEVAQVDWTRIFLTKEQKAKLNVKTSSTTVFIDEENITKDSRSSRRSRASLQHTPAPGSEAIGEEEKKPIQPTPAARPTSSRRVAASAASSSATPPRRQRGAPPLPPPSEPEPTIIVATPKPSSSLRMPAPSSAPPSSSSRPSASKRRGGAAGGSRRSSGGGGGAGTGSANRRRPRKERHEVSPDEEGDEVAVVGEEQGDVGESEEAGNGEEKLSAAAEGQISFGELDNGGSQPVIAQDDSGPDEEQQKPKAEEASEQEAQPHSVSTAAVESSGPTLPTPMLPSSLEAMMPTAVEAEDEGEPVKELPKPQIFAGMKFVLTSATRGGQRKSDFNKKECRNLIEKRGGIPVEDFNSLEEGERAFLIADTFYRTHKYLSALSLSIPCVKHEWILSCVDARRLIDHTPFMLAAGESILNSEVVYPWKPLKGSLLRDKRVWVHSRFTIHPQPGGGTNGGGQQQAQQLGFIDIWSPIVVNLGGELINQEMNKKDIASKLEYCKKMPIDYLITDSSCERAIAERIEADGGQAVSSEWVIQAIVTGDLPSVEEHPRFHYDYVPPAVAAAQPQPPAGGGGGGMAGNG